VIFYKEVIKAEKK